MSGIFSGATNHQQHGLRRVIRRRPGFSGLGEVSDSMAAQYADVMKDCANPRAAKVGYQAVAYGKPGPQTCWLANTVYSDGCSGKSQVAAYCAARGIAGAAPSKVSQATLVAASTVAQQASANIAKTAIAASAAQYPWGSFSTATQKLQQEVNAFGAKMVAQGKWNTYCQISADGKLGSGTCGALRAAGMATPPTCQFYATDCKGTKVGKGGPVTTSKVVTVTQPTKTFETEALPILDEESWLDKIGGMTTLIMGGAIAVAVGIVGVAVAKKKGLIGKKVKSNRRRHRSNPDNYREVRAEAQRLSNETGRDYGVEKLGGRYRHFMLPEKRFRAGHELRCEVVMCDSDTRMLKGHGYKNNRRRSTRAMKMGFLANPGKTRITEVLLPGDRVTILTPHGQQRTGTVVMRGPYGWVLNLGGKHGTPGIATDENIIKVVPKKGTRR
jgi:hypothetical protein